KHMGCATVFSYSSDADGEFCVILLRGTEAAGMFNGRAVQQACLSGEFPIVNKYLIRELIKPGL
ncbi:unnamed protein product, partial [Ectocarpus sp. 6 AP-2014]